MDSVLLLFTFIALLRSNILDALATFFKTSTTFNVALDTTIERVGLLGLAGLCLILYLTSSACLPVLVDHLIRITHLQQAQETVMGALTAKTLFSILDFLCAIFTGFALGYLAAYHNVLIVRLLVDVLQSARDIKTTGLLEDSLSAAKHVWTFADTFALVTGCLYEISNLSEQHMCFLTLFTLATVFFVSMGVLLHAVAKFTLELSQFLATEFKRQCMSSIKASGVLSYRSTIIHDLFLFIYMTDGCIKIKADDLPTPPCPSSPIVTTAFHLVNHIRKISNASNISRSTHVSAYSSKASGQRTAISQETHDSTTSLGFSGQSSTPSRPISRSSDPTTNASDLDECIKVVDACMDRIQVLEAENQNLRESSKYVNELEAENRFLRNTHQHFRRQSFQADERFQEHINAIKCLEAANAELLKQNEELCLQSVQDNERYDAFVKEFIRVNHPQHADLAADPTASSPMAKSTFSSIQQPITPCGDHGSLGSPIKRLPILPDTPSTGPPLPFSPHSPAERSIGHISPTSLIKPRKPRTPTGPGLPTPEAMKREFDPRVKIVVPRCPTTVSSGNSLPCPTTISSDSSYAFSPYEIATGSPIVSSASPKKHYSRGIPLFPAGPGLPCPMRLVFGDRIPLERSPSLPPSDNTPLPCPTPISAPSSFGRVSINSMNRPYFGSRRVESPLANRRKVDSFSPLSKGGMHVDPITSIDRPRYKTPAAKARAQRFSNSRDFERSPSIASSNSPPLPVPSPRPSDTSSSEYDPFI